MIKTILYYLYFGITLPFTYIFGVLPAQILSLLGKKKSAKKFITASSSLFSKHYLRMTGSRISVEGLENLPEDLSRVCVVSNHQSYFDIFVLRGYVPILTGFLAKKELKRIPLLNFWMSSLGCVFIDRGSPRAAVEAIQKGVESIKNGNPIVLFPEGTRSKSQSMAQFKPGGLKLAQRSGAIIVPVTLNNSCGIYEESGRISAAEVKIVIHKSIDVKDAGNSDSGTLSDKLWSTINSGLII